MFVEYKKPKSDHWINFGEEFRLRRNYLMYGVLAGVRREFDFSLTPKGRVQDAARTTTVEDTLRVCDEPQEGCERHEVNLETAMSYSKYGCAVLYAHERPYAVQSPDNHTHSWLTPDEYKEALKLYDENFGAEHPEPEYSALHAAMESLQGANLDCRVVFWFDN